MQLTNSLQGSSGRVAPYTQEYELKEFESTQEGRDEGFDADFVRKLNQLSLADIIRKASRLKVTDNLSVEDSKYLQSVLIKYAPSHRERKTFKVAEDLLLKQTIMAFKRVADRVCQDIQERKHCSEYPQTQTLLMEWLAIRPLQEMHKTRNELVAMINQREEHKMISQAFEFNFDVDEIILQVSNALKTDAQWFFYSEDNLNLKVTNYLQEKIANVLAFATELSKQNDDLGFLTFLKNNRILLSFNLTSYINLILKGCKDKKPGSPILPIAASIFSEMLRKESSNISDDCIAAFERILVILLPYLNMNNFDFQIEDSGAFLRRLKEHFWLFADESGLQDIRLIVRLIQNLSEQRISDVKLWVRDASSLFINGIVELLAKLANESITKPEEARLSDLKVFLSACEGMFYLYHGKKITLQPLHPVLSEMRGRFAKAIKTAYVKGAIYKFKDFDDYFSCNDLSKILKESIQNLQFFMTIDRDILILLISDAELSDKLDHCLTSLLATLKKINCAEYAADLNPLIDNLNELITTRFNIN